MNKKKPLTYGDRLRSSGRRVLSFMMTKSKIASLF